MKKKMIIPLVLVLVVAAVIFALLITRNRSSSKSDLLSVSGNIEIVDAEVSFKIPGRVEQRWVEEGQLIQAGQWVARIDSRELAEEVAVRRAQVQSAQAALAELKAGSRPEEIGQAEAAVQKARSSLEELQEGSRPQEIAAREAAVARARADFERWKLDHDRQEKLYQRGVISAREYEIVRSSYEAAQARLQEEKEHLKLVQEGPRREQIEQGRAALRQVKENWALIRKGPRQETIDRARANLEQARQSLAQAETRLSYTQLLSPLTGVVLSEHIEPGEYVSAGTPIITVGQLNQVWLRAYVNETDLGRVRVGQPVEVSTDTYPGKKYEGKISFIASQAEFTPKNVQTSKERVKLVYRIKIDISNPNMELKPGMPADGKIRLK